MRCSVGFFAGELQFHVKKEPQNDPKIVEKSFGSCLTNHLISIESYQNFVMF